MTSLLFLAAHMVGDYVTQTNWMAANKLVRTEVFCTTIMGEPGHPHREIVNFWHSAMARTIHVALYTAGFVPVAYLSGLRGQNAAAFLAAVFVTHWLTDCRRWASGDKWPAKPILVDQTIHIATLAAIGVYFGL
jgi:hypothetical protein